VNLLIENPEFRRAVELLDAGDVAGLRAFLKEHPDLVRQRVAFPELNYFQNPTLLEFAAENPVRNGKLPPNIVEIAGVILDAGPPAAALGETLALVASGRVPRECNVQRRLIDFLCDHGADPNFAMKPAAVHGEMEAVHALIARGARVDLPIAAALDRIDDARRLLPAANAEDRQLALAYAAQFGHSGVVRLLLDAGVDPSGYNPMGAHAHSTPLHQAALAGHDAVVRLLVDHGARLDVKDLIWHATPAGWAAHAGRNELAEYLYTQEKDRRAQ
jgi:hypothetical protein